MDTPLYARPMKFPRRKIGWSQSKERLRMVLDQYPARPRHSHEIMHPFPTTSSRRSNSATKPTDSTTDEKKVSKMAKPSAAHTDDCYRTTCRSTQRQQRLDLHQKFIFPREATGGARMSPIETENGRQITKSRTRDLR